MSKPKLALIPSGYKSGKVYSILPNDFTGDFDFTRQSIGTRVRKDGLIEEAKTVGSITNLQPRSEEFDNSVWTKTRTTITADQELAPNGTNTADKLTGDGTGTSYFYDGITFTSGKRYSISIFVKRINVNTFVIQNFTEFGTATFDIQNGTLSGISGSIESQNIEILPNDWYRCSAVYNCSSSGSKNIGYGVQNYNGDQFYIWGAMVSEGALSDYIKTEGSSETKRVETFTDVPRLDWLNSNCPSLLLEPQRTNAFTYSQDFSNSNWAKTEFTVTSNEIIAPDGTLTASELFETSATSGKFLHQNTSVTTGNDYTISYFVKYQNKQFIQLTGSTGFDTPYVNFDILNGEIVRNLDNVDASIENFGNGWYRISLTLEATSTTSGRILLVGIRAATSFRAESYTGDTSNSYYIWGGQMEQGSYPTSYIKTEASTVTRLKDEVFAEDSDLFNITEGTLFVDATPFKSGGGMEIQLSDGTASNRHTIQYQGTGTNVRALTVTGGSVVFSDYNPLTFEQRNKLAITFKEDEFKFYVNGSLVHTDTSGSVPTGLDKLTFSNPNLTGTFMEGKVHDIRVYNTALTEAEAIELTT